MPRPPTLLIALLLLTLTAVLLHRVRDLDRSGVVYVHIENKSSGAVESGALVPYDCMVYPLFRRLAAGRSVTRRFEVICDTSTHVEFTIAGAKYVSPKTGDTSWSPLWIDVVISRDTVSTSSRR